MKLLREPLLHFLLLGGLIFAVLFDEEAPGTASVENQILIEAAEVERMAAA
ncbi:hypothetical protein [uncultured Roseovarius sp.]|nr:hypothetical protein [uncultured Roseovarius sp.]